MILGDRSWAKLPGGPTYLVGPNDDASHGGRAGCAMPKLSESNLVFVDVETTGLSPAVGDRIVEIALITCRGGRKAGRMSRLVNPGVPIPREVQQIHQIRDSDVAGCPRFDVLADDVARRIQNRWLVGHNLRFDIGFVAMELALAGKQATPAGCFDTRQIARAVWDLPDYRLDTLTAYLGLGPRRLHRAMNDAATMREVFDFAVQELGGTGNVSTEQLAALHNYQPQWPAGAEESLPPLLYDALATGQSVRVRYADGNGAGSVRTIRPVACFAVGRHTYIKARCALVGELRTFRVDRIMLVGKSAIRKQ